MWKATYFTRGWLSSPVAFMCSVALSLCYGDVLVKFVQYQCISGVKSEKGVKNEVIQWWLLQLLLLSYCQLYSGQDKNTDTSAQLSNKWSGVVVLYVQCLLAVLWLHSTVLLSAALRRHPAGMQCCLSPVLWRHPAALFFLSVWLNHAGTVCVTRLC